jgi:hypothetical protein
MARAGEGIFIHCEDFAVRTGFFVFVRNILSHNFHSFRTMGKKGKGKAKPASSSSAAAGEPEPEPDMEVEQGQQPQVQGGQKKQTDGSRKTNGEAAEDDEDQGAAKTAASTAQPSVSVAEPEAPKAPEASKEAASALATATENKASASSTALATPHVVPGAESQPAAAGDEPQLLSPPSKPPRTAKGSPSNASASPALAGTVTSVAAGEEAEQRPAAQGR